MNIIYRISDTGYNKVKPNYINNENCLKNCSSIFKTINHSWHVIADNVSDETYSMILKYIPENCIIKVSIGHGAGTFNLALDKALSFNDNEVVYFIENDYLHKKDADKVLLEGFGIGSDYVSLYDHPDKYIDGANPLVESGGEITRVMLSNSCHWKITNSTTMTFASKVKTLKEDESILRKWTGGSYPQDFQMFLELASKQKSLVTPIPGYSTHGETNWLTPLINWNDICNNTDI
jgi:hypothetical protein